MTSSARFDWRAAKWAEEFHDDSAVRRDIYQEWIDTAVEDGGAGDFIDGWVGDLSDDAAFRYPDLDDDELAKLIGEFEEALRLLFTAEVGGRIVVVRDEFFQDQCQRGEAATEITGTEAALSG